MDVRIKRVYEPAVDVDGHRVLIDRLWPRGVRKDEARLELWLKDAAPSPELRRDWHADPRGHEPARFEAFAEAYRAELAEEPASSAVDRLVELGSDGRRVTLLYGAHDEHVNHAIVLRDAVLARAGDQPGEG